MSEAAELYEADILGWSERQAALLRRVAAGERINSAELDWCNIIEEVESVGREQLHAVESLLTQASSRFSPSMRQRIDVARLYRRARQAIPDTIDGQPPLPVPAVCPVTLDQLLSEP